MAQVKIGFLLPKEDVGRMVEFAQEADRLGYEIHCPEGGWSDPFTMLAAAAAATKKSRLYTHVTVIPYYHPWHLTRKTVTLDHLSNGRFTLLGGVGWRPPEFENLGVPYTQRGKVMDEMLHIMTTLMDEGDINFEGRYFNIKGLVTKIEPCVQKPHVPIIIGGGPRAMVEGRPQWPGTKMGDPEAALKRVAKYGDGWSAPSYNDVEHVTYGYNQCLKYAKEAGRQLPERFITLCTGSVNINFDEEAAARDVMAHDGPRTLAGDIYRSEGNPTMDARLGKVFSGAVGAPEKCVTMMGNLIEVPGLDQIVIHLHATDTFKQMELFDKHVKSQLPLDTV